MKQIHVLTTNATDDIGLSAVVSMARAGYKVSTADVDRMAFGIKSRFASGHHVLADGTGAVAASLLALVDSLRPDVFLPIGMRAARAAAACREQLATMTAVNIPDRDAFDIADDKAASMKSVQALGVPCARVCSRADATRMLSESSELTIVVKPSAHVGSARGVVYVTTPRELDDAIAACRALYGEPLIQEYVPGDPTEMKTVMLLYSRESRLVAAFTTSKKRQWPPTGGLTVVSRSTDDEAIVEQVRPFFEHWHWRGVAEVELKRDCVTGVAKVIEINPRFPAYLRFADRCGLDFATTAVRAALDPDIAPLAYPAYRVGVTYMNPVLLMKSAVWHARRARVAELPRIVGECAAGFHCGVDMLRDPLPLFARYLQGLRGSPRSLS